MSYADILTNPSSASLTKTCSKVNGPSASTTARSSGPRNASAIRSSSKTLQSRVSVRDGINTGDTGRENTRQANYTAGAAPETGSSADQNDSLYSVKLNENCDDTQSNHSEDVFRGVRYKRNARYYVSGIDRDSNKHGILRYVENKGVKVTHMVMFKPRTPRSQHRMKINVPLAHASIVERYDFWPDGVECRRWYSNREWEARCSRQERDARNDDYNRGYNSNSRYMDDNSYKFMSHGHREWWQEYDNDQDVC